MFQTQIALDKNMHGDLPSTRALVFGASGVLRAPDTARSSSVDQATGVRPCASLRTCTGDWGSVLAPATGASVLAPYVHKTHQCTSTFEKEMFLEEEEEVKAAKAGCFGRTLVKR